MEYSALLQIIKFNIILAGLILWSYPPYSHGGEHVNSADTSQLRLNLTLREETVQPRVLIPGQDNTPSNRVFVKLSITNPNKQPVSIHVPMWFTSLQVQVDGKTLDYIGPALSMPPPTEADFKKVQQNMPFEQEVVLNSYFNVPMKSGKELSVTYSYLGKVAQAKIRLGNNK